MDIIKSSAEISDLFGTGKRIHTPYVTLIVKDKRQQDGIKQHDPRGRVAFVAGKKQGNAVWRNAAKRRMRAVCRDLGGAWAGYDIVFLAKSALTRSSYSKVLEACENAIERCGMACEGSRDE